MFWICLNNETVEQEKEIRSLLLDVTIIKCIYDQPEKKFDDKRNFLNALETKHGFKRNVFFLILQMSINKIL